MSHNEEFKATEAALAYKWTTKGGHPYKNTTGQVLVRPLHKEKEEGSATNIHFTHLFKKLTLPLQMDIMLNTIFVVRYFYFMLYCIFFII
jgi:hypothetical protein